MEFVYNQAKYLTMGLFSAVRSAIIILAMHQQMKHAPFCPKRCANKPRFSLVRGSKVNSLEKSRFGS